MKSCDNRSPRLRTSLAIILFLVTGPAWACWGPFFSNDEIDKLSLLEPTILADSWLEPFFLYASAPLGVGAELHQNVIHPGGVPVSSAEALTNLFEYDPGNDPALAEANEAEWLDYFVKSGRTNFTNQTVTGLLYEKKTPFGLTPEEKTFFDTLLGAEPNNAEAASLARGKALNSKLPEFLRARWAYLAVRGAALAGTEDASELFGNLQFVLAKDKLSLYRARGWKAYKLLTSDPQAALGEYLSIFDQCPELRAVALSSLSQFSPDDFDKFVAAEKNAHRRGLSLFVSFLLAARDFSPETLDQIFKEVPGETKSLFVLYRMVEEVEREAGISKLLNLTSDPAKSHVESDEDRAVVESLQKKGLYTALVNKAASLGRDKKALYPRVWLTLASYLSFYDGDLAKMKKLYQESLKYPAANDAQAKESDLVGLMVKMADQVDGEWDTSTQQSTIDLMEWARHLDQAGNNRGLYHSLVVLSAQKYLARDRRDGAASALFTLHGEKELTNLYTLDSDSYFWAYGGAGNNVSNIMSDVLLRDEDLSQWKDDLGATQAPDQPLLTYFMASSLFTVQDLDYLQAYRYLRRNEPEKAQPILDSLEEGGFFRGNKTWRDDGSVFPVKSFRYSLSLDPLDIYNDQTMEEVSLQDLAKKMAEVKRNAGRSSQGLLAAGVFWTSLQISGFPLIFCKPPQVIHFVRNLEFYGYDGSDDLKGTGNAAREFPFFQPLRAESFRQQLRDFQAGELSGASKAKKYFQEVLDKHNSPDNEIQALMFIKVLDPDQEVLRKAADPRYMKTQLYKDLKSYCEDFRSYL